jgi:hypothetical protein
MAAGVPSAIKDDATARASAVAVTPRVPRRGNA